MKSELPRFLSKGLIFCMKYGKLNKKKLSSVQILAGIPKFFGMIGILREIA